jgi:ribonucleoside-diphosphate reductase alpha chain
MRHAPCIARGAHAPSLAGEGDEEIDERGYPVVEMGVLEIPEADREPETQAYRALPGKQCKECGNFALIKKDGCEFCTACGAIGACG